MSVFDADQEKGLGRVDLYQKAAMAGFTIAIWPEEIIAGTPFGESFDGGRYCLQAKQNRPQ